MIKTLSVPAFISAAIVMKSDKGTDFFREVARMRLNPFILSRPFTDQELSLLILTAEYQVVGAEILPLTVEDVERIARQGKCRSVTQRTRIIGSVVIPMATTTHILNLIRWREQNKPNYIAKGRRREVKSVNIVTSETLLESYVALHVELEKRGLYVPKITFLADIGDIWGRLETKRGELINLLDRFNVPFITRSYIRVKIPGSSQPLFDEVFGAWEEENFYRLEL